MSNPTYKRPSRPPDLEARITFFSAAEGGRRTPACSGYRPNHDFGLPGELNDAMHEYPGDGSVEPGAETTALLWLLSPERQTGRLYVGLRFTVQEGNRIVGRGVVAALRNDVLRAPDARHPRGVMSPLRLVKPHAEHLDSYVAALRQGWSADASRGVVAALDELARIEADAGAFLASLDDREARGPALRFPDGSTAARIPGYRRWLWDTEFCGSISLRWQPGTTALPPYCLGHIGYAVVPWKQRRGYATEALRQMLPDAWALGLPFVEVTTDPDNVASQRVIEANGGVLFERFIKPPQFGEKPGLRYRIHRPDGDA